MYLKSFMFAINISLPHQPYSATIVTNYCHMHHVNQDVTCARIQLTETQARLNAMVYCLGSKSAEHKSTKGMLNLCLQEGAQGGSQT
jgi:hypothetical protein